MFRKLSINIRKMQGSVTDASPSAGLNLNSVLGLIAASIAMAVLMSLSGAYGTHEVAFWPRLTYWTVAMLAGSITARIIVTMIQRFGPKNRPVFLIILSLGLGVPVVTLVISSLTSFWFGFAYTIKTYLNFLIPVLVISVFAAILTTFFERLKAEKSSEVAESIVTTESTFFNRLPPHLRQSKLYALSAEDHYLRVYTEAGDALILMRLSDAIAELAHQDGAQTHRSWWVSRQAIKTVQRLDGRAELRLENGLVAPVSRSFLKPLKDRYWLY